MLHATRRRFIRFGLGISLGLVTVGLFTSCAGAQSLELGKPLYARAIICSEEAQALKMAEADQQGPEAFVHAVNESPVCGIATVHIKLHKVIASVPTERGTTRVIEVTVEMADDTWQTAWILADQPIRGVNDA